MERDPDEPVGDGDGLMGVLGAGPVELSLLFCPLNVRSCKQHNPLLCILTPDTKHISIFFSQRAATLAKTGLQLSL